MTADMPVTAKRVMSKMKIFKNSIVLHSSGSRGKTHFINISHIEFNKLKKHKGDIFCMLPDGNESYYECLLVTGCGTDYVKCMLYSWNRNIVSQMYGYENDITLYLAQKGEIYGKVTHGRKIGKDEKGCIPEIFRRFVKIANDSSYHPSGLLNTDFIKFLSFTQLEKTEGESFSVQKNFDSNAVIKTDEFNIEYVSEENNIEDMKRCVI